MSRRQTAHTPLSIDDMLASPQRNAAFNMAGAITTSDELSPSLGWNPLIQPSTLGSATTAAPAPGMLGTHFDPNIHAQGLQATNLSLNSQDSFSATSDFGSETSAFPKDPMHTRKRARLEDIDHELTTRKEREQYAKDAIRAVGGLDQSNVKAVMDFSLLSLPEMMIHLFAKQRADVERLTQRVLELELEQPTVRSMLKAKMVATLCNPDLGTYCDKLRDKVVMQSLNQPTLYNLTAEIVTNPVLKLRVDHFLGRGLIEARADIKRKIATFTPNLKIAEDEEEEERTSDNEADEQPTKAPRKGSKPNMNPNKPCDIYALSTEILKAAVTVSSTPQWWARLAYLRQCLVDFSNTKKSGKGDKYWDFVDQKLSGLRAKVRSKPAAERSDYLRDFYYKILKQDLQTYPPKDKTTRPTTASISQWQASLNEGTKDASLAYSGDVEGEEVV